MIVTGIEEISKNRSKVYIDKEFAFVLYKGELHSYHIKSGLEISKTAYEEIMTQVLPRRAKLRAMNLLQSREYTEAKLRTKLKQGLYPDSIINIAIDYVKSYRYVDDKRYALDYITYNDQLKSRKKIDMDLMAKGICRADLDAAWGEWEKLGGEINEDQQIRELLIKKHYDSNNSDIKEKQKIIRFLVGKGFNFENIKKVISLDIN